MPKLTKQQYLKWNAQAANGFSFDVTHFCVWGEKRLIKDVEQANGDIIRFLLEYISNYTTEFSAVLNVEQLTPRTTDGVYTVRVLRRIEISEHPEKTKKYSVLCRLSAEINTDEYLP